MSIVVEGMISKLKSAPDYDGFLDTLVDNATDFHDGMIPVYLLRLVDRDKAEELLKEMREEHESLFKTIDVLSGKHDARLFEQMLKHEDLEDYLESLHCDLPEGNAPLAEFYAVRLLASDAQLPEIRKSFDDLKDTPHMQAACLRMLEGTETQADIDAILASEHPEDVAEQEAQQAAQRAAQGGNALEATELDALRELRSKLSAQGRRSGSQETLLAAVGKVLDAHD